MLVLHLMESCKLLPCDPTELMMNCSCTLTQYMYIILQYPLLWYIKSDNTFDWRSKWTLVHVCSIFVYFYISAGIGESIYVWHLAFKKATKASKFWQAFHISHIFATLPNRTCWNIVILLLLLSSLLHFLLVSVATTCCCCSRPQLMSPSVCLTVIFPCTTTVMSNTNTNTNILACTIVCMQQQQS